MKIAVIAVAVTLAVLTLNVRAQDTNHPSPTRGNLGPGPGGFHILPPRAQEQLNLTVDQQKQVADLEAEVKTKMETILTPAQLEKLKQMRPPRRPDEKAGGGEEPANRQRPASE